MREPTNHRAAVPESPDGKVGEVRRETNESGAESAVMVTKPDRRRVEVHRDGNEDRGGDGDEG